MHAPANQPDFKADAQSEEAAAAKADPGMDELNRIVDQAEALLRSLAGQTDATAQEVRDRVTETLNQARARLAVTASEAEEVAATLVDRTDEYVRSNPWRAVTIAALLGGVVAWLMASSRRN